MFKTPLQVEGVPPNLWRLLRPLVWSDEEFGRLTFHAGLVTDLASIPRLLRAHASFDPCGPSRRPAVGHDDMYARATADGAPVARAKADRFLYVALRSEGVSARVAWAFWAGVRLGGWMAWNDYRRADAKGLTRDHYNAKHARPVRPYLHGSSSLAKHPEL